MFTHLTGIDVILISAGILVTLAMTSIVIAVLFDDKEEKKE